MKKIIFIISCVCSSILVNAQIVLTNSSTSKIGTNYYYSNLNDVSDTVYSNHFNFSISGNNNIWDFSNLPMRSVDSLKIINPFDGFRYTLFPNAKYAIGLSNEYCDFYSSDSTGLYWLGSSVGGWASNISNQPWVLSTPLRMMKFPYTKGIYSYSETRAVSSVLPDSHGFPGDSSYSIVHFIRQNAIVASGNIVLPSGTYPALLEWIQACRCDTIMYKGFASGGQWQIASADSPCCTIDTNNQNHSSGGFQWYIQGLTYPVAALDGNPDTTGKIHVSGISFLIGSTPRVGIPTINFIANDIFVYPNPTSDKLFLNSPNDKITSYTITDILGNYLITNKVLKQDDAIDISKLSNGIYSISFNDENNSVKTLRVVKQ